MNNAAYPLGWTGYKYKWLRFGSTVAGARTWNGEMCGFSLTLLVVKASVMTYLTAGCSASTISWSGRGSLWQTCLGWFGQYIPVMALLMECCVSCYCVIWFALISYDDPYNMNVMMFEIKEHHNILYLSSSNTSKIKDHNFLSVMNMVQ